MKKIAAALLAACLIFPADLAADETVANTPRRTVQYDGSAGRDPFKAMQAQTPSPRKKKAKAESYTLEGLIWQTSAPQAIINGQIVRKGSRVSTAEVIDISEKGVKIKVEGKHSLLKPKETGKH